MRENASTDGANDVNVKAVISARLANEFIFNLILIDFHCQRFALTRFVPETIQYF